MKKIIKAYSAGAQLGKEILRLISTPAFSCKEDCGYFYTPASFRDLAEIESIYFELNGTLFSKLQRISLLLNVKKCLLIVKIKEKGLEKIVGMNFYYINKKDFKEKTIHEGFIGVLPAYEGQGLATEMRKIAILHFAKAGFMGISTRVSKGNLGSLRSAEKLGFLPTEEYFDSKVDEVRYYMVCKFGTNCD